jgi:hypothetical protein
MRTLKDAGFIIMLLLALLATTNIEGAPSTNAANKTDNHFTKQQFVAYPISTFECGVKKTSIIMKRDCTVRVTSGGIDVEVTFYDVSWWTCTKLKVGAWWHRTFK